MEVKFSTYLNACFRNAYIALYTVTRVFLSSTAYAMDTVKATSRKPMPTLYALFFLFVVCYCLELKQQIRSRE